MRIIISIMIIVTALVFSSSAFGAVARCKIVKAEGNKINLECKNIAGDFKKGE